MSDELEARPYQLSAIDNLRDGVRNGHKRQILSLPTGAGKSFVATKLIQEADKKLSRAVFAVDRIALVDQIAATFDSCGIGFGIMQGNHWRCRPWERIQVGSIPTLARRGFPEDVQLLVWDECHVMSEAMVKYIEAHPQLIVVGLTATPFTKGLGKIYSNVVNVTTTNNLVDTGFLAPVKAYAAKRIDMKGAKIKFNGEWEDGDIEKRGLAIVGDVVQCWIEKSSQHFGGSAKTMVFSATVAHGEALCAEFQEAGYNFQQISYKDGNDDGRRQKIEEFRKPDSEIMGLVSCEALGRGADFPDVKIGVSCRPYRKSLSSHIQQLGRVMRTHPLKEYAIWNCHSGNFLRFADDTAEFFSEGVNALDEKEFDSKIRKEPEEKERDWSCQQCHFIMAPSDITCPSCGWVRPKRWNDVEHEAGELHAVDLKNAKKDEWLSDKQIIWRQIVGYALATKPPEKAEKWALAQYRNLYDQWPKHAMRNVEPMDPSPKLVGKLRSMMIRYFKGKAKREQDGISPGG